ncbi:MAG: transglutaminase-like domain-containing protein, partial [Candidatus Binatia bacterium]
MKWGLLAAVLLLAMPTAPAAPGTPGDAWTQPARYAFEYRVDLQPVHVGNTQRLRLWVPYPAVTPNQRVLSAQIDSPWAYQLTRDRLGNRILYMAGTGAPPTPLVMRFTIERWPSRGIPNSAIAPGSPLSPEHYRAAPRLIPLAPLIRRIAEREGRGLHTSQEKVRAFYDYVVRNMRYDKHGKGWGRGDAIWACTHKHGNCTDFHSLFIGLALTQEIPARFVIGFPIPLDRDDGTIPGYHCWAEYYDQERGWVPLDSSEGKRSGNPDAYF